MSANNTHLPQVILVPRAYSPEDARALAAVRLWEAGFGALESWTLAQGYELQRGGCAIYTWGDAERASQRVATALVALGLGEDGADALTEMAEIRLFEQARYILEGDYACVGEVYLSRSLDQEPVWAGPLGALPGGHIGHDLHWTGGTALLAEILGRSGALFLPEQVLPFIDPQHVSVCNAVLCANLRLLANMSNRAELQPDDDIAAAARRHMGHLLAWRHECIAEALARHNQRVHTGQLGSFVGTMCPWTGQELSGEYLEYVSIYAEVVSCFQPGLDSFVLHTQHVDMGWEGEREFTTTQVSRGLGAYASQPELRFLRCRDDRACLVLAICAIPYEDCEHQEAASQQIRDHGLWVDAYTLNGRYLLDATLVVDWPDGTRLCEAATRHLFGGLSRLRACAEETCSDRLW